MDVGNINEASEAAAHELTEKVEMRDGSFVTASEMVVSDFIPLWKQVQSALRAGIESYLAWQATQETKEKTKMTYVAGGSKQEVKIKGDSERNEMGPMDAEQTKAVIAAAQDEIQAVEANRERWFALALKELENAPDLLLQICVKSSDKDLDFWNSRKLGEWLKFGKAAYRINFSENEDVQSFFADTPLPSFAQKVNPGPPSPPPANP